MNVHLSQHDVQRLNVQNKAGTDRASTR